MPISVEIRDGAGGTRTKEFARSPVRIGRNQLNDIALEDPFVSEWHGVIRFDDRVAAYTDLGSTNGTVVDGRRLTKNEPVPVPAVLQLGQLRLTVSFRTPAVQPPVSAGLSGPNAHVGNRTMAWDPRVHPTPPKDLPQDDPWTASPIPDPVSSGPSSVQGGTRMGGMSSGRSPDSGPRPVDTPSRPQVRPPEPAAQDDAVRVRRILEAFSEAFVGLRRGYEQFGAEVGVRTIYGTTPLHRAQHGREVLDYLLSPGGDLEARLEELTGIFADMGIHQMALMEGFTQGVQTLLHGLDPRAHDLDGGPMMLLKRKAWNGYQEQFQHLIQNEEELHSRIFGEDFARAYASVAGEAASRGKTGERSREDES